MLSGSSACDDAIRLAHSARIAGTIAAGSLLGWTLMGMIPVAVGLISLFSEIRSDKTA
jgi:hypothetical protein